MDPYVAGLMPSADVALALEGYNPTGHSREMPTQLLKELQDDCFETLLELLRPYTQPLQRRKHIHLSAQHNGVYDVMWQIWISAKVFLEGCLLIQQNPLTRPHDLLKRLLKCLLKPLKFKKKPMENRFVNGFGSNFAKRFATKAWY